MRLHFEKNKMPEVFTKIENDVKDIKETNQFVLPEVIRYNFPILTNINIFSEIKKISNKEMILMNKLAYVLNESFAFLLLGYIILNIAYSVRLKHIPILDVTLIATGFLLRIFAGGIVADVFISRWIILMTFLLALFLALAKRREDVLLFNSSGNKTRKSVDGYNLEFINISLGLMAAVTIVAYIMYTLSPDARQSIGNENIYLTTVFVILGMLRYLQITMVENKSGAPAKMLWQDRFLQFTLLGWMVTYYFFLYIEK
jgi:4-hydroxybenzoate polyprenyltransferase